MNKTLRQRSKLLNIFRSYFRANKDKLYLLTPKQRDFLNIWAFSDIEDLPQIWPANLSTELTKCAMIIRREQKKRLTLKGKVNYIESLDIHNTHPKLYNLCLKLRIRSLHELDVFINAARSGSSPAKEIMRQYPLILGLIDFYDEYRNSSKSL